MYQKLINYLYRYPKSSWKNIQRFGGLKSYYKMLRGKKEMIKSSHFLPEIISTENGLPIYFLTGKNYLYQTLFCARSLVQNSAQSFQFILVDDGSFDEKLMERVNKQMPGVQIITSEEIKKNIEKILPKENFPYLHLKREVYPHIKKLTDIHTIVKNPYKLVLDSDMLFYKEPIEIINWLKDPSGCIHMLDCEESYGYDKKVMGALCGKDISPLINVGVLGIPSSIINWSALEIWSEYLEKNYGASYFLEQALSAMILAELQNTTLNREDYIVNPSDRSLKEDQQCKLHHYVDLSKKLYFEKAWKKAN